LKSFKYELEIDEGIYDAINRFAESEEGQSLKGSEKKFLDDLMLGYKRSGFELDASFRREIKDLKSQIDGLGNRFRANIAAASSDYLIITPEQIGGLDSSYLAARVMDDGNYKIDVSYPSYRPFMKYSTSDSLRRTLSLLDDNRGAPENIVLLDSILYLRNEVASKLGYSSYAALKLSGNMAKTPEVVWDFENDLIEKVKAKGAADIAKLIKVKSEYLGKEAEKIELWESSFYSAIMKQKEYKLDEREVKNYFEQNAVLQGLFAITQKVLGLKYEEIDSPSVWHPDVRMFNCYDAPSNKLIGRFYLDMYPRENKYSHAAMFTITGGMGLEDGGYEIPEASLVCNFPKPEGGKPSLMSHGDVETFFHEFGHLLHGMVTKARIAYQSGPEQVVLDFVEAPSQIYENWAWNKETLAMFAKHYETGEMIPDSLLDKMLSVKNLNSGTRALGQLFYGTYALTLHDKYIPYGDDNTTAIGYRLMKEVKGSEFPEGAHFEASFGHLIGYSAAYYSYLWSKVYAQDMWSVFEEQGPLNPEVGMKYRQIILEPSDSRDALEMVKEFLGRDPNNEALLKDLGLEVD
ncbi:MAG: Zn-dependent oligopeptidase, partial [Flavobacteriales bacterium]|nr:Zn-dependent oligopeptidase [Flavobacteriales bacterium]